MLEPAAQRSGRSDAVSAPAYTAAPLGFAASNPQRSWLARAWEGALAFATGSLSTGAAVAVTGLLGVYGNRWTTEILDAFDSIGLSRPIAVHAVIFYTLTALLGAFAVLNVIGNARQRRHEAHLRDLAEQRDDEFNSRLGEAIRRLEQADEARGVALDRLEVMMQTLPDEQFLQKFVEIYQNVHATVEATLAGEPYEAADLDELKFGIRGVLNGIASLAQAFDGWDPSAVAGGGEQVVYGANVMVFYSESEFTRDEITEIRTRLKFVEPEIDFHALDGVLDLRPDLSTSTDSPDPVPDPGLRELALPIPKQIDGAGGKCRLQPGAPDAFVYRTLQRVPSGDELIAELERRDLSPSVKESITAHFRERKELRVRSFISVPLLHPQSPRPLGVLNIHRSRPGLLRDANPEQHFTPVVSPVLLSLSQLLFRLLALENSVGAGPTAPLPADAPLASTAVADSANEASSA